MSARSRRGLALRPLLLLPLALAVASPAAAGDENFVPLAEGLVAACSQALAAAKPAKKQRPRPPRIKNLRLRKNLKDLRDLATRFLDKAQQEKARGPLARTTLYRLRRNLRTANYLIMSGAAFGQESFPAAFEQIRSGVSGLTSEMCCGEGA